MQTIIMTVGTSLRTNPDFDLKPEEKRPWAGKRVPDTQKAIENVDEAIAWMYKTPLELISAETNTFWRLDLTPNDQIVLLHSETISGLECAEITKQFLKSKLGQNNVELKQIPGINYELDESGSTLEKMADLLQELIKQAKGVVTLAATGGFKAQTMVMAIVGNSSGIPVCYVHEQYKALIYLPYFPTEVAPVKAASYILSLPESSKPRSEVVKVQESKKHHRPKTWNKVKKMLEELPWVEFVRFEENAFSAPKNGVKAATRGTKDGSFIYWMHLYESEDTKMAISIETTGYTQEHGEAAAKVLREKLGRIIS